MGHARRATLVALAGAIALPCRIASSDPSGDPTAAPLAVRVTASALNVREGPSTGSSVVGTAAQGQVYAAIAHSGDWWKVWFADRTAWVHGSWLENDSSRVVVVNAAALNVRAGPSTSDSVLGTAPRGAAFAVRASSGSWLRVDFAGRTGWVSSSYVASGGATSGSSSSSTSKAGFISLAAQGTGYYSVSPASRRWGTPRLVYGLERVARRWQAGERPAGTPARLGIMDLGFENGGPISGHASHQKGVDADLTLPRTDGKELPRVDRFSSAYSRAGTQRLVNLCRSEMTVTNVFFNDPKVTGVSKWPNHDNHVHVRIK